jgi:hypothetical protein
MNFRPGDFISVRWHEKDEPTYGTFIREERGYHVMSDINGDECPFLLDTVDAVLVTDLPIPIVPGRIFLEKISSNSTLCAIFFFLGAAISGLMIHYMHISYN